jgi:peptidylprolyl isomerase
MKFLILFFIFITPITFAKELQITNNIEGSGLEIINHSKIEVHYLGKLEDGTKFDSSYDRGEPLSFQIGMKRVIEGWELGLLGMKVGGKRTLFIPSKLGYGQRGAGDLIPPNSNLIFDVEIIDVQPPGYKTVLSSEIKELKNLNYTFIDIRIDEERLNTGMLDGSIPVIAFDEFGKFVPEFMQNLKSNVDLNDNIVFISNDGDIASILANGFVEQLGAKNMHYLKGGIQGLIKENYKLSK